MDSRIRRGSHVASFLVSAEKEEREAESGRRLDSCHAGDDGDQDEVEAVVSLLSVAEQYERDVVSLVILTVEYT